MREKIINSAWIVLGGVCLTIIPYLTAEIVDWLTNFDPIDWRTPTAMLITAIGTWVVNTIRLYLTKTSNGNS